MDANLSLIRKTINEINQNRSDFLKNPAFFIKKIAPELNKLRPSLYKIAEKLLSSDSIIHEDAEKLILEINLFLSTSSDNKGVVEEIRKTLSNLKGFGDKTLSSLINSGLATYEDLLLHFPYKYDCIYDNMIENGKGLLSGEYKSGGVVFTRNKKRIYKAIFSGKHGTFQGVWFHFNAKYPSGALKIGKKYHLFGNFGTSDGMPSITHPEFLEESQIGVIRPIYSIPKNISLKKYRDAFGSVFTQYIDYVPDNIPVRLLDRYNFPNVRSALRIIHFPNQGDMPGKLSDGSHPAVKRFIYEELFYLQIGLLLKKESYRKVQGIAFNVSKPLLEEISSLLPFKLTGAQKRSLVDILNDMKRPEQMNRLIQGDVGSGKTIIAFIAGLLAVKNGYQVAIIAPTEVLAEQHYINLMKLIGSTPYTVALLTGSVKSKDKNETYGLIAAGAVNIVIGTHAVIQESVNFEKLGLAIIDEQHRFGVMQRKSLIDKGYNPDILLMTATPIPRTMAMTFYGDLDVSAIDEMPPGRIPIKTESYSSKQIDKVYKLVKNELEKGHKAYFVYPLIESSDKLNLKDVETGFSDICSKFGKENCGLLHGRMKGSEKKELMDSFKNGNLKILVSTTVIEVGVDVPEATVMVIENAERFGLSQLHQLRGRVGRSSRESYCILVRGDDISEEGVERISSMVKISDGFKLSEIDLKMRGPGDFFGTRQSGLPEFRFSNIARDVRILQKAREDASEIIKDDPDMKKPQNKIIVENLKYVWRREIEFLGIG